MKKLILFLWVLTLLPQISCAQSTSGKKLVSLEDVWQNYTFYPRSVRGINWMKDGQYYTSKQANTIVKRNISTGQVEETLYQGDVAFDSYSLSPQEDQILLANEEESIYRRSSKAHFYVYQIQGKKIQKLSEGGKQSYATFSPNGERVAFVRENNLYFLNLSDMKTQTITQDGKFNFLIHGSTDWVYEEEFSFAQAFFWSPDSKKIAFFTFDESEVKEYNMQKWEGAETSYPYDYRYKYPKAGEANSKVSIHVHDIESGNTTRMDIGQETDIYIPRINWTQDPNLLSIRRMNRLQNKLEILHANVNTGKTQVILTETSDTYVDLDFTDDLTYLENGQEFLHTSEKDGYKHIYLYDLQGKLIRQLTQGEWEVSTVYGVDEKNKLVYFSSTEVSPLERQIYAIGLNGKGKKQLSQREGTHRPNFSRDFKYYLDNYSSHTQVPQVSLHKASDGKLLKTFEDNSALEKTLSQYQISPKEYMSLDVGDGLALNAWMIKPSDFQASKKYPVLMFVYGGPGSQTVTKSWDAFNFFWYQTLADKGYIIVSVDNRGTGARGEQFKKITYANLGKYETEDQIAAAKALAKLPYIDAARMGIWGWSYGGYMSSLSIMLGNDVFKTAIAVAPVTTWRFYDTIYTERYLKKPQDNPDGYDKYSPINHVEKLKGKFLLVHGTGDDNVHFQNSVELQNALIAAGKQFDSFYYPNRAHGISRGQNTRYHLYQMMSDFLEENL